jgi:hypothetical protein
MLARIRALVTTQTPAIATTAAALLALLLTACASRGRNPAASQSARPPIDLAAPVKTETATFALG